MDKATLGGLAMGVSVMVVSIMIAPGARFSAFLDYPSLACVVGGAIAATCIAFPLKTILSAPRIVRKIFAPSHQDAGPVIDQLVELSELARRDGILSLDGRTDAIADPFLKLGIEMAVDGTEPEVLDSILRAEMEALAQRHKTGKSLMDTIGRYAPAFGMIGTLLGLIIMLGNMSDPDAIGPGMAVALITTLYGSIVANMFALPFADKLAFYSKRELEVRELIIRGIRAIQEGDNPRIVEQKLNTMLPVADRQIRRAA